MLLHWRTCGLGQRLVMLQGWIIHTGNLLASEGLEATSLWTIAPEACSKLSITDLCCYNIWGFFFFFLPGSLEKHQVSYLETKIFCHQPTLTVSKGCPTSTPAAPETKQTAWLWPAVPAPCWDSSTRRGGQARRQDTYGVLPHTSTKCFYASGKLGSSRQGPSCATMGSATSHGMLGSGSWPQPKASARGRNCRLPRKRIISSTPGSGEA